MHPKVSVIMATYNHGPFVAQAIKSVLSQDFTDFEFIISDDGSTDDTRNAVASIDDPRIQFFPNTINRGACVVTNELISKCKGTYIALLNSDDRWLEGKLSRQVEFLDTHPEIGAVFGRARFIDKDGAPIAPSDLAFGTVFDQANRSRGEWLRRFFDEGNCLCHPTIMVRRSVYEHIGEFNNRYRQLPDMDMWIRLVKHYDIHVTDSCEIEFRIMPGENASSQNKLNAIRTINEHYLIAQSFFSDMNSELLKEGFHDRLQRKHVPSEEHLEIEKALLFRGEFPGLTKTYALVGLEKLYILLCNDTTREILLKDYHISDGVFHVWSSNIDTLRPDWPADNASADHFPHLEEKLGRDLAPDPSHVSMTTTASLVKEVARRVKGKLRESIRG
ncbi:glycosyltransferase [Paraburkholderia sp. 1N]|uniref:Glycosyltransferase n=1 Tax=Paraburkholderia solitsugae TaxID=2675748 RepID=A0ABX2BR14_9BURK|nr:glycosyltransferase [Paraburkholderia solitsugae]NPT42358.1 glycosyltransferase [Paraburkholderia solitsugae]